MYIVNADENFLKNHYKCSAFVGKPLEKRGCLATYKNSSFYYFVKTDDLEEALRNLPRGVLFLERIIKTPSAFKGGKD